MPKVEIIYNGVLEGHKDAVYALKTGQEPYIFFSAGGDGQIVKWDLQKKDHGELVARLPMAVYSLLYFKKKDLLIAGCRSGSLYVFDLANRRQEQLIRLKGDVFDLCYLPGTDMFAAACADGHLYVISTSNYEIIHDIHPTSNHARTLALNPDHSSLASGWSDGKIRIFETKGFAETESFIANQPSVFSMVFSNDGKKLISGGRDARIRVWDASLSYIEDQVIPAHLFTVNDLILIPELNLMVSASRDKTVKIWDSDSFA